MCVCVYDNNNQTSNHNIWEGVKRVWEEFGGGDTEMVEKMRGKGKMIQLYFNLNKMFVIKKY